jgi:thiamine kinase-like enzyme
MQQLFALFDTRDEVLDIQPLGTGKINHTFLVQGKHARYVLQQVNNTVFPDPDLLMQNIDRVTHHITQGQPDKKGLRIVKTLKGELGLRTDSGYWRCFPFIEHTIAVDVVDTPRDAFAAAKGFGDFLFLLSDLSPGKIRPVLPGFHDVHARVQQLEQAVLQDRAGRWKEVQDLHQQIKTVEDRILDIFKEIQHGAVPTRITHNDTKISNVLLDTQTFEPVAVVDLDTVMPGSALFDIGDMIRTFVCPVDENEPDLSKITIRADILEALVAGYHQGSQGILTPAERERIIDAGMMLLFTQTIRFLADYLNGDVYYKTDYPQQNLIRTRNQWQLLALLQSEEQKWRNLVRKAFE